MTPFHPAPTLSRTDPGRDAAGASTTIGVDDGPGWGHRLNLAVLQNDEVQVRAMLAALTEDPTLGDLNTPSPTHGAPDKPGRNLLETPLETAIYEGHLAIAHRLIADPRVNVNRIGLHDWPPLHLAVVLPRPPDGSRAGLVRALLRAGADSQALGEHVWKEPGSDRPAYDLPDEEPGRVLHVTRMTVVETVAYMGGDDTGALLDVLDQHGALPPPAQRWTLLELAVRAPSDVFFGGTAHERRRNTVRDGLRWLIEHGTPLDPPDEPVPPTFSPGARLLRLADPLRTASPCTHAYLEQRVLDAIAHRAAPDAQGRPRSRL